MKTYKSLLYKYYKITYKNILGVNIPNLLIEKEYVPFFKNILGKNNIKIKIKYYKYNLSPKSKVSPLLNAIKKNNITPKSLLDFGCGEANCTKYLVNNLESIKNVIGIDNDLTLKNIKIKTYSNLHCVKNLKFDIITFIHVLHHIKFNEQISLIKSILKNLNPNGILYIYEDSWSNKFIPDKNDKITLIFQELNVKEKRMLFLENEYWSNNKFHKRNMDITIASYRSAENWLKILKGLNLKIMNYGIKGFNNQRLHGVPSIFINAMNKDVIIDKVC